MLDGLASKNYTCRPATAEDTVTRVSCEKGWPPRSRRGILPYDDRMGACSACVWPKTKKRVRMDFIPGSSAKTHPLEVIIIKRIPEVRNVVKAKCTGQWAGPVRTVSGPTVSTRNSPHKVVAGICLLGFCSFSVDVISCQRCCSC